MNINLIDTLIDEYPVIDTEKCTIHSDIFLSQLLGHNISGENKSELIIFAAYLDNLDYENRPQTVGITSGLTYRQSYNGLNKYRKAWNDLNLDRFIISKRLLEFLMRDSGLYIIRKLFSFDFEFIMKNKKNVIEIFTLLTTKFNNIRESEDGYIIYGDKSIKMRYGKFVHMIGELFSNGDRAYYDYRMKDLEASVDIYKSKFSTTGHRICVLNGKDILLGYNRNYQIRSGGTMLSQSCMNDKKAVLKLYTNNPSKIYLLVIINDDGKIISRNLIWRLEKYNNFLFDRVYAMDNYIRKSVIELADLENWIKYEEGYGIQSLKRIDNEGVAKKINGRTIKIKLNMKGIHMFPYLDTFRYQRLWNNVFTNKKYNTFHYRYDYTDGGRRTYKFN